jgi:serine/alanine adding enzyme
MKYSLKSSFDEIDEKKWSKFVYEHEHGNIFQTPEFYKLYSKSSNYQPEIFCICDDNEEIVAILLVSIIRVINNTLGYFTSRAIIQGGPIVKDDDEFLLELILEPYLSKIKNKAIFTEFRNMRQWSEKIKIFTKKGFSYNDHLNILVDLNKNEESLWSEVHSKRRNEIRRAKKEGTTFSEKSTAEELSKCYDILTSVYQRAKLPLPNYDFFNNLYKISNDKFGIKIFCAENNNKVIGCLIALVYKNRIYDYFAGSYFKYYKKYPNDLIPWEVFIWGKKNNYNVFDFGGAGKPNVPYGVRDYKKKFGGEIVSHGRFVIIHKPIIFSFAKRIFKIWQRFK